MARNRDRFARATGMTRGYRREQVDGWLNRVETAMRLADGVPTISSAEVRRVGFDLVRRGYDVAAVDAHLDRLEELAVAAEAEGEASMGRLAGSGGGAAEAERLAHDLQAPDGERFSRAPLLTRGYDPRDVDGFVEDVLLPGLTGAAPLPDVDEVRSVVFRARRGGYDEGAVDDALDAVVDHLLRRERVVAGFVPSYAGGAPEAALPWRGEAAWPAAASSAAAVPSPPPAVEAAREVDPDDAWAVDGWLPEPHRGRPAPVASAAAVDALSDRSEDEAPPESEDAPTVLWAGGLPAQAAGEPLHPLFPPLPDDVPEPVQETVYDRQADEADRVVHPVADQVRSEDPLARRTSTGTGWPG